MKKRFSISEAASMADMTSETLRHYDRIGLVAPHEKDPWTGYRTYSEQEIVRLQTIQALRCMDLSLKDIQTLLAYDDLEKIVESLKLAERSADEKIAKLQAAKAKIRLARSDYEKKLRGIPHAGGAFTQELAERWIMLSDTLRTPTLDALWQYHRHFYDQIEEGRRAAYTFEDLAGIYTRDGCSRLFAVCIRYPDTGELTLLPAGTYLCADCAGDDREKTADRLMRTAEEQYGIRPAFHVELVVVSGILQWKYQLQLPV